MHKNRRLIHFDTLKGIAILLVVWGHVYYFGLNRYTDNAVRFCIKQGYRLGNLDCRSCNDSYSIAYTIDYKITQEQSLSRLTYLWRNYCPNYEEVARAESL